MLALKQVGNKAKVEDELQKALNVKAKMDVFDRLIKETLQARQELLSSGNFRSEDKIHQLTKNMEAMKEMWQGT